MADVLRMRAVAMMIVLEIKRVLIIAVLRRFVVIVSSWMVTGVLTTGAAAILIAMIVEDSRIVVDSLFTWAERFQR